ncbi:MAG: glycosyltransferase [Pseudoxanthomonas sp.]
MTLPVIVLPVGSDDVALDACLAALDAGTPAGAPVWLADDAQAGPRGQAVIQRWLASTPLQAEYTRRTQPVGAVAHLDQVLAACGGADVLVLAPDAIPAPGWAIRLAACGRQDSAIATATPWCNAGETAAWPRVGEVAPLPPDLMALAVAAQRLPTIHPELPAAVDHAVWINGRARQRAGGLDMATFDSWYAALIDLSLRLSGLGWRNVLCETAFVARRGEGGPADGELERLASRWPGWQARIATFLMDDPLHALRASLTTALTASEAESPQRALFD